MSAPIPGPVAKSPEDVVVEYTHMRPLQEEFTHHLTDLLRILIAGKSVEVHGIEKRTKTIESFREKIVRGTKGYSQPLDQITDLTGVRVIVYYNDDVDIVSKLIEEEFDVDKDNSIDKRQMLKPQEFGYQSTHYVVRMSSGRVLLTEWKPFAALRAEIQVRTVLQHAWAAISHKLAYKRETDIPSELRRKLFRLSALLELGDDEFLSLRDQTQAFSKKISRQIEQRKSDIDLDLVSLRRYLAVSPEVADLVTYGRQAGFEIDHSDDQEALSDSLRMLLSLNVSTIGDLERALLQSKPWAARYFKHLIQESGSGWSATPSFMVLLIVIARSNDSLTIVWLMDNNWNELVAKSVMDAAAKIGTEASSV